MNDYKDKYTTCRNTEVLKKELIIKGVKVSDIKKEDIEMFCKSKGIPVEWLIIELIKNID